MTPVSLAFVIAAALGAVFVPLVRGLAMRIGAVDYPNSRSSHKEPTPRAGGLAVVLALGLTVPWLVPLGGVAVWVGLAVGSVAVVSLWDDIRSLPCLPRFVVQGLASVALVVALDLPVRALDLPGLTLDLPRGPGMALSVLFLVAYCNIFNFMDGINGLASGQSLLTAAALSAWLWRSGCAGSAAVAAAVAGASAGFLPHNFPRAGVFLGDVGSVTLGLTLAVLTQTAHARGGVPWTALLLIHAAFLFDALFTILKRAARRESIVQPHREHNYQLLVRSGWSHTATTAAVLSASAICCGASFVYARPEPWARPAALGVTAVVLAAYAAVAHTRRAATTTAAKAHSPAPEPVAHV